MKIIDINLLNKQLRLSCPDESVENLKKLAVELDAKLSHLHGHNPNASFDLLLVMLCLQLLDQKFADTNLPETASLQDNQDLLAIYQQLKDLEEKL